ncbi:unnamed protein product, partial [Soboliphyme baturini]|uniref:G_PROTEIN_RECEP_F1_2 domain-containing protein n=1 Tax=Soboliphyme baturini TaxID=241478 RepID=A0A183J6U4_9BILA
MWLSYFSMNVSLTTSFDQLYSPQTLAEHNNRQHNIEAVSYITNGLFSVLINCMVLVVARMTKPYGKQMLLLSAFAFSVFLVSCGYLADGLRRVAYSNSRAGEMAIRQCFFVGVHLPLFYIGETAESFLLLHLSFDRFLAMISPAFYSRLNFQVTKRCFLTEYAVAVASSVTMMVIIVVLYGDDVILAQCYFGDAIPKPIKKLHNYWYIVSGFISIVAYIVAVACCCYRRKSTIGNRSAQCKREIKLTKRVALIVVTTFLSGVFPLTL